MSDNRSAPDAEWIHCTLQNKAGLVKASILEANTATIDDPMHEAAKRGNAKFLRELIDIGASVNGMRCFSRPILKKGIYFNRVRHLRPQDSIMQTTLLYTGRPVEVMYNAHKFYYRLMPV